MATKENLHPFQYKGIRVRVCANGVNGKFQLFTVNGRLLYRDSKEEMIKAIDYSLAAIARNNQPKEN